MGEPHLHPIILPSTGPMSFLGGRFGYPSAFSHVPGEGGHTYPVPNEGDIPSSPWGVPRPGREGGTPVRDWMGETPPPLARTGRGYPPWTGLDGIQPPPPPPQETEQHSEYLLHGRWYTPCHPAGGLSCFTSFSYYAPYSSRSCIFSI